MGFDFGAFMKIAELLAPAALAAAGVPPILIPLVSHGIVIAEQLGVPGQDKKKLVLDVVGTTIASVNAVKPGTIDPNVTSVVDEGIDATVGAINGFQKKPITVS